MAEAAHGATIRQLLAGLDIVAQRGDLDQPVRAVQHDSRRVGQGDLFFALSGARFRGLDFADQARERGAVAVVADEFPAGGDTAIQVRHVRPALAQAACIAAGHPTRAVPTVGITGTNGKTTTAYLLEAACQAVGQPAGVIGTIDVHFQEYREVAGFTTPEAPELQRYAAQLVARGAQTLVMEVTSHALTMDRVRGCRFRVVAFTNLTQDHLDHHRSMEEYAAAKLRLFTAELEDSPDAVAVINIDDPAGAAMVPQVQCPVVTVSAQGNPRADLVVRQRRLSLKGVEAEATLGGRPLSLRCPLVGEHNLANLVLTLGVIDALGLSVDGALQALAQLPPVPGRLEPVPDPRGSVVLVDYAHTPDALQRVSEALRPYTVGRLIVVFGCGGDRDQSKRPPMAAAAASQADLVLVTSDNPRREEPQSIIDMALPGVQESGLPRLELAELPTAARGFAVEVDRRTAIRAAIMAARPQDVVLIAGKGHEPYQVLGETKIHFDDREEARAAIEAALAGAGRPGEVPL